MFLLGVFSFVQITFLPGYLFLRLMKLGHLSLIKKSIFTLGLSLYLNYQFVLILTYLKLYTQEILLVLFIVELLIFSYYLTKDKVWERTFSIIDFLKSIDFLSKKLLVQLCVLVILFFISIFIANLGTVFYYNDAIKSWNIWAIEWANNSLPSETGYYPQLIPINMSIPYMFTLAHGVSIFSKAFMPLIFISMLLIFFDLGMNKKNILLVGLLIYALGMPILYSLIFIADGNTEIAVSFFGFLVFYSLYNLDHSKNNQKRIYLAAIFASSAALTKLAGGYIVILFCLWLAYYLVKMNSKLNLKTKLDLFSKIALISIFNLLWYLIKPMSEGLDQSAYLDPNIYNRFLQAFALLKGSLGLPILLTFIIGVILSLFVRRVRLITITLVIPILILWTFFYSYDTRNLNISLPFIALVTPFGLEFLVKKFLKHGQLIEKSNFVQSNKFLKTSLVIGIIMIVFAIFNLNSTIVLLENINRYFRMYYFGSFRMNYTVEIGYYRYVQYFVDAIRILCIILLGYYLFREYRIKTKYIIILALLSLIILNFTILNKQQIINKQVLEEELIAVRNISTLSKLYSSNTENDLILTNYPKLIDLSFSFNMKFNYSKDLLEKDIGNNKFTSLLLYKKIPLPDNLNLARFDKYYENNDFVFFKRAL